MFVIGLTGGIGTGKSTVSLMLQELGARLLDADKVGHEALLPDGPAYKEVVATFGADILNADGTVERPKLGALVFNDVSALGKLNAIMHPRMARMMRNRLDQWRAEGTPVAVLEAAILFEAGWTDLVDQIWVTSAPEDVIVERLMRRNNWTAEHARARLASQMPLAEKAARADVVIDTNCSLEAVRQRVETYWRQLEGVLS